MSSCCASNGRRLTCCFPGLRSLKLFEWSTSPRRRRNGRERGRLEARGRQPRSNQTRTQMPHTSPHPSHLSLLVVSLATVFLPLPLPLIHPPLMRRVGDGRKRTIATPMDISPTKGEPLIHLSGCAPLILSSASPSPPLASFPLICVV